MALAFPLGTLQIKAQEIYDLLLKNGHVLDPANHRDGRFDVAVSGNKIVRVGRDLPASHARIVVEAGRYFVTPGPVDIHAHFYWACSGKSAQAAFPRRPWGGTDPRES